MKAWIFPIAALTLTACNLTEDDNDALDFVCAMESTQQWQHINIARIFRGTLSQGWFEIPEEICESGAGQLFLNDAEDSVAFRSKLVNDEGEQHYYSKASAHQLGDDENNDKWFHVEYSGPKTNDRVIVLHKDENLGAYKVWYKDEANDLLTIEHLLEEDSDESESLPEGDDSGQTEEEGQEEHIFDKNEVQSRYPQLSSDPRAKTGKELHQLRQLFKEQN